MIETTNDKSLYISLRKITTSLWLNYEFKSLQNKKYIYVNLIHIQ